MSTLTKDERDGLEDVFMSIHKDRYSKFKEISSLIMSQPKKIDYASLLKQAKMGLKELRKSQYILNLSKKKKNLSK